MLVSPAATAAASAPLSKVVSGLVDVDTNLGYENAAGAGTGMLLSSNGEVLTNNHVIRDATTIEVRDVANGRSFKASVVGYDVTADVAVVKMTGASGLQTAPVTGGRSIKVGASVTAIGNAGGAGGGPTETTENVTALDQSIAANDEFGGTSEQLTGLVETDAGFSPGTPAARLSTRRATSSGCSRRRRADSRSNRAATRDSRSPLPPQPPSRLGSEPASSRVPPIRALPRSNGDGERLERRDERVSPEEADEPWDAGRG